MVNNTSNVSNNNQLPDDWDEIKLEKVFPVLEAGVSVNSDETAHSFCYVLKTSAIHNGKFDSTQKKPVINRDCCRVKCPVVVGSIIISRMNTPQLVGECGYVDSPVTNCYLPDRLWQARNITPAQYDFKWLSYVLSYGPYRNAIREASTGTSNSMKNISKENLLCIAIPKPEITEQRQIAKALSDIDELIFNLEKFIKKKKAMREGAVQELIVHKKALPGFDNTEMKYRIGNIGDFYNGLSGKTKKDFGRGTARYITFLNVLINAVIDTDILESVDVASDENQNSVRVGDLFFNTSSETPEEVGMCAVLLTDVSNCYLNSFCFGFRIKEKDVDPLFFSYYFNSAEGRKIMAILAQGATRYNLSKTNFADTNVILPEYKKQKEIARIISDMDSEIASLQSKLEKYRKIKSGMMDELLTGKVRLV